MVAEALEFGVDLEVLIEDPDVLLQLQVGQQLDHVAAAAVGEVVDVFFLGQNLLMDSLIVVLQQGKGFLDVVPGSAEQGQQQMIAALQGKGRRVDEAGIQRLQLVAVLLFFDRLRLVLHDAAAQLFIGPEHGEEADGAAEIEDGIGVGDHAGIHRAVPQPVQQTEAVYDRDAHKHQDGLAEVEQDVHNTDALGFRAGANGADDGGRDAVAEVDADDHRIDGLESQHAGGGKGLQNTHCDRGALQHESHTRAGQIAQEGVLTEAGEEVFDRAGLGEAVHGARHIEQAGEQDAEADRNVADGLGILDELTHDQHHAEDERDRSKRGGLEESQPGGAGGVDIQKADDLAGDRRADVRPDDDAEGLAQRQDARADKAGGDDDHSRRGLNERCDKDAQKKRFERVVGHLFHGALERAGGVFFQRIPHQPHAVQEHGKAAEQGDHIKYIHKKASASSIRLCHRQYMVFGPFRQVTRIDEIRRKKRRFFVGFLPYTGFSGRRAR